MHGGGDRGWRRRGIRRYHNWRDQEFATCLVEVLLIDGIVIGLIESVRREVLFSNLEFENEQS